jgi:hypothetical protein
VTQVRYPDSRNGPTAEATDPRMTSDFDPFRDLQRIIEFNAKVPDSAVHLWTCHAKVPVSQLMLGNPYLESQGAFAAKG